ncbi:MAG: hypothetical protein AAF828_08165, partial [Bacteroidota bacterium]
DRFADALDERQRFLLCYLLPEAYRVVGNWQLTQLFFQAVLRKPIELNLIAPLTYHVEEKGPPLSDRRLGNDTLLGDHFQDDIPALEVTIKGITAPELEDYLESGKKLRVVEDLLYSYFLPLEVAVITKVLVTGNSWYNELGITHLGYNLKLSKGETT